MRTIDNTLFHANLWLPIRSLIIMEIEWYIYRRTSGKWIHRMHEKRWNISNRENSSQKRL